MNKFTKNLTKFIGFKLEIEETLKDYPDNKRKIIWKLKGGVYIYKNTDKRKIIECIFKISEILLNIFMIDPVLILEKIMCIFMIWIMVLTLLVIMKMVHTIKNI